MRKGLLLNGFVLALLAAAVAGFSFISSSIQGQAVTLGWQLDSGMVFDQDLQTTTPSVARLNGRDSVTLLSNSQGSVHYDEATQTVTVNLVKGGVVFSTLADDFQVKVLTPFARVSSQHSTATVALSDDSQNLTVYAVTHPSLVTFTTASGDLNSLSVPNDYRMKIPASKVTDLLGKLRLTKLTKEFPVFALADGDLNEEMTGVLASVQKAYDDSSVAFLNQIQSKSDFGPALSGFGGTVYGGYTSFRDALTVLPTAKVHLEELRKEDSLVYAMTNYLYGDATVAQTWLTAWSASAQDQTEVQKLYSSLFFVLPGDQLYAVKAAAASILYPHEDPLTTLRRQYGQIESLLDRASQVEAQQAYLEYQTQFEAALNAGSFDDLSTLSDISREYTLLELMLRSNAVFYNVSSTKLLSDLEEKILALAGSSQDLDEERQAFVQSKLRFLGNLFTFVEAKKVSIADATDLANELIFEANTYMGSITTQVAVTDYFKTQLKEDEVSVQFMNAPEFYSYASFADGLTAFKAKQTDLAELNAYIQNIRSGQTETATLSAADAQNKVEDDLITHSIQFSSVVSLGDSANRLFEIEGARTAGYAFQAKYDRETQILYDVVVGDLRFSTGLNLADANKVIKEAMAAQAPVADSTNTDTTGTSTSSASLTESVALELAKSQFKDAGLNPDDFVFTVVDTTQNTFSFEGTMTAATLPVSGSYDADTKKVSEIVWQLSGTPETLPDTDLSNFEGALEATYQALTSKS